MPSSSTPDPLVLLAGIALPEADTVSAELIERLGGFHVVLVGWFEVPEQTTAEQARDQFEDEVKEALQAVADRMRDAGAAVETRLVFTDDRLQTMERLNEEIDSDVVLLAHPHEALERILVPIRGWPHAERIAQVVARLAGEGACTVSLLRVQEEDEDEGGVLAFVADELAAAGVPKDAITINQLAADDPAQPMLEQAQQHDLVVMGASKPSVRDVLFGAIPERIASKASVPVMVVSARPEDTSAAA
jgi:nucleotide-binding universal stress UspA family protein